MSDAASSPAAWPLLVRCVKGSSLRELERLQLIHAAGETLNDEENEQLAKALVDATYDAEAHQFKLKCPRISVFAARSAALGHVDHGLALVAAVIALTSMTPPEAGISHVEELQRLRKKSLRERAHPRGCGLLVLDRERLAPLVVEHSPERCTSFGPAAARHHDLMAPEEHGEEQDGWIRSALRVLMQAWVDLIEVLTPTIRTPNPGERRCIAFRELVDAVCAHCNTLEPGSAEWPDRTPHTAAIQKERLDWMKALVSAAASEPPPAYAQSRPPSSASTR